MPLEQIAPDVWRIPLMPRDGINAYVIGDVLIDAGLKQHAKKILKALDGREIRAHAITHAHQDHAGGSKAVAEALGVPVWAGAADAGAMASGVMVTSNALVGALAKTGGRFPARPIDRELHEGDEVGPGFVVLDVPGHSPGHVAYWRASDRTLIAGDVFFNMNLFTTVPGLRMPFSVFTPDPARNRASARRLAALEPAVAGFGHGPVLRDPAAMPACVARLPQP